MFLLILMIVAFEPWFVKPWLLGQFSGKLMVFKSNHESNNSQPTQDQSCPESKVHQDREGVGSGEACAECGLG
jgi:hypothetical protein